MPTSTPTNVNSTEDESAELTRFREQWKAEVRRRREEQQAQSSSSVDAIQPKPSSPERPIRPLALSRPALPDAETKQPPTWSIAGVPQQTVHTSHGPSRLTGSIARAVEIYRSAVQNEQESNLDEALRLYRQAFRLNPDVDRAYFKEEQMLQQLSRVSISAAHKKTSSTGKVEGAEGKENHVTKHVEARETLHANGILSKVLASFPDILTFEPEDDREGVPINMIPAELLLSILRTLDTTTLERFAAVSRRARVLSLDPLIWRDFVYMAYKPPQIPETDTVETIVDRYDSNYRQTYIEHPRLRLDGVYIAVCHYVRRGLGENAWVNVSHLITYHRYLRFFPDGQVLSLLANEEYQPSLVIPMLKPSLRMKGFYIGDWRLEGSTVIITNLIERHPHAHPPHSSSTHTHAHAHTHTHTHNHIPQPTRYHFQMTLSLRSKPLGRWNKLDLVSYESVNIEDGEIVPLPLKHERPFWFSKVKSWQGY